MSDKPPGDPKAPVVETTLNDLRAVDTDPLLKPVPAATITLDEDVPAPPSATQLLNPVDDGPTNPRVRVPTSLATPQVLGESRDATPRKRASIKSDAFESSSALRGPAPENGPAPRGPPPAWERPAVWTPGLIVLVVTGALMLLLALFVLLQGWS